MGFDPFAVAATRSIPKDPPVLWVTAKLWWHRLLRPWRVHRYRRETAQVLAQAPRFQALDDETLDEALVRLKTQVSRRRFGQSRAAVIDAVALLREIARRTLHMAPYAVQVRALLALYDGFMVQVAPGEGKTLTLGLLAVLRGWEPTPCHLITANEYLAHRDLELLAPLFFRAGIRAAAIKADDSPESKRQAYAHDVVYATAKQLVADHLIDRVRFGGNIDRLGLSLRRLAGGSLPLLMQRGLGNAIVDEADQILIDEAITPMIISEPESNPVLNTAVLRARDAVHGLEAGRHYKIDPGEREVRWQRAGEEALRALAGSLPPIWRGKRREALFAHAVLARDRFIEDQHYVIADDKVVIVDEGTGRTMPGRSWSYGLHQAIEAKAGVALTDPSRTLARLSFQNFFKLYGRLCGASGTLHQVDHELCFNYRVFTLKIPSRRPTRMRVHDFEIHPSRGERLRAVVARVQALQAEGRAVLIGTRSVADSETLADALGHVGVHCQLLNAKLPAAEAEIIRWAGEPGRVTVATNMAGRGTDIQATQALADAGGLCVIMFEPHESARIDWQLFGRTARQGQPGEVFRFASLEDELLTRHLPTWSRPAVPLSGAGFIRWAQARAGRRAFRLRRLLNRITRETRERLTFTSEA